jgi:hypothetical protein
MRTMGLERYCLDINNFDINSLISTFFDVERDSDDIKLLIMEKIGKFRRDLEKQYNIISRLIT